MEGGLEMKQLVNFAFERGDTVRVIDPASGGFKQTGVILYAKVFAKRGQRPQIEYVIETGDFTLQCAATALEKVTAAAREIDSAEGWIPVGDAGAEWKRDDKGDVLIRFQQ